MAAKSASLALALDDVTPPPAAPVRVAKPEQPTQPVRIASREGTALIGAHLPKRYAKAMKRLSADVEKTHRELLEEAIHMLFVRYGVKL